MKDNTYTYHTQRGKVVGKFNIYQARNGGIYIVIGVGHTKLTKNQILTLNIEVTELIDFDVTEFQKHYKL